MHLHPTPETGADLMPVEKDWDLLIHRYLEGDIGEAEAEQFNEAVKSDSRVRRRLAEMAFDEARLPDVLSETGDIEPPVARPWGSMVAAAVVVITVAGSLLYWSLRPTPTPAENKVLVAPEPTPPEIELEVRGTVTSRKKDGGGFVLRVSKGLREGSDVHILPAANEDKKEVNRRKVHRKFIRRLRVGQELTVRVRRVGDNYVITKLTEKQLRRVRDRDDDDDDDDDDD